VSLKHAGFDGHSPESRAFDEVLIQRTGSSGGRGGVETWAASLAAIAVQGELRDHEQRPTGIDKASVHLTRFVGEHPQVDDFVEQVISIGGGVGMRNAKQYEQAFANTAPDCPIHIQIGGNTGARNALKDGSHDGNVSSIVHQYREFAVAFTNPRFALACLHDSSGARVC
jgi:hypothetical protein